MTVAAPRIGARPRMWPGRPAIDGERLLLAAIAGYVLVLCLVPLLRLAAEITTGGGLALVADTIAARAVRRALWHTIEAGLASVAVSVAIGAGMALLVGLTDLRLKAGLVFLLLMPMMIPPQITALAWLELVGPSSPLRRLLGAELTTGMRNPLYSREGVVALLGIEHATLVFLTVRAGLRSMPRDLVEAARAAGAGPLRIVATIVLPLLRPAIVAGAALAFVAAIGNFGVPALLGIPGRYPMLTTLIYQRLNGFGPSVLAEVAVLAGLLALLAALGFAVQAFALRRHPVTLDRSGAPAVPFALGRLRLPVELLVWTIMLVLAVLPLVALVSTSLLPALGVALTTATATLDNYAYALSAPAVERAFVNSFVLAAGAALAAMAVSLPLAWFAACRRSRLARLLDMAADAPYALPGIVLAIAMILVFLRPLPVLGVSLYGTLWIMLLAYLARFLALALRPTIAAMSQIDPALEEAARIAGAGGVRRMAGIVAPLVLPAAAAGALLVFMSAFNELTVSILLWSSGRETLGVIVYNLHDEGNSTASAAVAVLVVAVTLALALGAGLIGRRLPAGVLPWQG